MFQKMGSFARPYQTPWMVN